MDTLPPGPSLPPVVQTLRWMLRPIPFLERCRRRHGDVFTLRRGGFGRPMVIVSDPELVRAIYTDPRHEPPGGRRTALQPAMGARSVMLAHGAEHLARRRALVPAFHGERMRAFEPTIREITERAVDSWPDARSFAALPRTQALTLEVVMRVVFGVDDAGRRARLRALLPGLIEATASPARQLAGLVVRRAGRDRTPARLRELRAAVDAILREELGERRDGARHAGDDVLSRLMAVRLDDGMPIGDEELLDQLVTLLLAGHETTAAALAWTLHLLAHHPEPLARATSAVRRGDGNAYLRAVVMESLRVRPVVPLAGRRLAARLDAGSARLPPGTEVAPSTWLVHTRADLYEDPLTFRPERWVDAPAPGYAWIPFGGGVRRCMGAEFAQFEMRVVLDVVLRRRDLAPAGPRVERPVRRNVTLAPDRGGRIWARAVA